MMKRLWTVQKVAAIVAAVVAVLLISAGGFCYRRFCDLDSHFYDPDGDTVIRLRVERSFEMPVSFTVIRRGDGVTLEVFSPPGSGRDERWTKGCWRSRDLGAAQWAEVQALVREMDIRVLANEHQPLFMDGSTWRLSIRTAAGLERAMRRCPDGYQRDRRYQALCALGLLLDEASGWPIPREGLVETHAE